MVSSSTSQSVCGRNVGGVGRRLVLSSALGLAVLAWGPSFARADDAACISAHVEAQRLEKAGKARAARDALVTCAKPECPAVLVTECSTMLVEIEGSIPTVVLSAKTADGADVGDVEVREGERVMASRLDGKALEVDPGEHTFRFTRGGAEQAVTVIVLAGDKNRAISVTFGGPAKAVGPASSGERAISPGFWVSGAVGLAGLALFAGLGGAGLAKKGELDERACRPDCDSADVDEVRGLFLGADIALGVGLAGLAVAPIFYFTSPVRGGDARGGLSLGLAPTALTLEGTF